MALGLPDMDSVTPALHKLNPNPLCNHLSFAPIFFSLYLHASFPPPHDPFPISHKAAIKLEKEAIDF